jgi:hypothetical protein
MKKLFILIILVPLWLSSYSQIKLPEIGTTETQATTDLVEGNINEEWFSSKDKSGNIVYKRIFKNTPVGISHSFVAFEQVKSDFKEVACKDESLYSISFNSRNNTVNYDLLSMKIKDESAEVNKHCTVKDDQVISINLKSVVANRISYVVLVLSTNKKG